MIGAQLVMGNAPTVTVNLLLTSDDGSFKLGLGKLSDGKRIFVGLSLEHWVIVVVVVVVGIVVSGW